MCAISDDVQQAIDTIVEEIEEARRRAIVFAGVSPQTVVVKTNVERLGWYMAGLNTAVDVLRGGTNWQGGAMANFIGWGDVANNEGAK